MFSSRKTSAPASGGLLSKSLRFRNSASAYLNRTPSSTGSTQKLTYSTWVKRGTTGVYSHFGLCAAIDSSHRDAIRFTSGNAVDIYFAEGSTYDLSTSAIFVDPSAWYHIVVAIDTTQSTASNRVILYVNNQQITLSGTQPTQNYNFTGFNVSGKEQDIGRNTAGSFYYDGYLADTYLIDGQQLTPSSFASTNATTGQWSPAKYSGTYGTNGFHLTFANTTSTTTLGYDTSGNGNNWTTNNISLTAGSTYDSMNDVPVAYSATAANYAVLNPNNLYGSSVVLTNGNLTATNSNTNNNWYSTIGTLALPTSSKIYWEFTCGLISTTDERAMIGVGTANTSLTNFVGLDANSYGYYSLSGNTFNNNNPLTYGASYTTGDVIGIALDTGAGTLTFYKNGTSQGTAYTVTTTNTYFPIISLRTNAGVSASYGNVNFGQQPFTYTPPSGYNALNTYNLPTPTIAQGNKYMDATLFTGNASTQVITNASGFQPDFVWTKSRNNAYPHFLYDSNRGVYKYLTSNNQNAEATDTLTLESFNSNGFTLGADDNSNYSGSSSVAWQWQAGKGTNSSNTNGSITSTVSVSTTAGFSVVTYTGTGSAATVGHGLGVTPSMIIAKSRNNAGTDSGIWVIYHIGLTSASYFVYLNLTDAQTLATSVWNATAPTSSVFSIGTASGSGTASTHVAYCFAPVAGFSAFGSYTGNGSSNGPFVYLGFQPKYLLIKRIDSASDWYIWDSVRNTFNTVSYTLKADTSAVETNATAINILSNGFQCADSAIVNVSSGSYIYACFASNPFAYSNAF